MAATEAPPRRPAPDRPTPDDEEERTPDPEEQQQEQPDEPEDEEEEGDEEKPPDLNALLEKADANTLRKNRRLMGIAGEMAKKLAKQEAEALAATRAEAIVKERLELERAEADRQALLRRARAGDYQGLGERHARDLIQQDQNRYVQTYQSRARQEAYASVQTVLDEIAGGFDPEVVAAAADKVGDMSDVTTWTEGFKRWLPALVTAQAESLARSPGQRKRVESEVTPAVRQRVLAEMNGSEPVADSGSGRAPKQRVVTDEQIAGMEPEEWQAIYDVKAGKFKPGITYRPTRGVNPNQHNGRVVSSSRG